MSSKKLKLPYGMTEYKDIINQGYYYVDRTKYIELLEDSEKFIVFIRPRRFGKSLFISTLEHYYDINSKDNFDKLFGKLYIGKNPTKLRNSYLVLKFDFSGINTTKLDTSLKGFYNKVRVSAKTFLKKYNHILKIPYSEINDILNMDCPELLMNDLLQSIAGYTHNKIYILIDEYDHFANELLTFQYNIYQNVVSKSGFVRKFYEILKASQNIVDRIFITGISPLTLDSLTTGFNITKNKSTDIRFNEMLGFKDEEVIYLIQETVKECEDLEVEDIFNDMKKHYDGYLFNEDAKDRVFNSDMVLYYLTEIYNCKKPKDLLDTNIASDYSKIRNIFHIKNTSQNYSVLKELIENDEVSGSIVKEFSLEKRFDKNDLISLLFYSGIVTIKGHELSEIIFQIPNYIIKELYYQYFVQILADDAKYYIDISRIIDAVKEMALFGKLNKFIDIIQEFLESLSRRDYINFNEKYIKIIMMNYLMLSKIYYVKSEPENRQGYSDLLCIGRDVYDVRNHWLIELKYLKTTYTERELEKVKSNAILQINKYNIDENLKGELHKVILIFSGKKVISKECM